ncbi:MAG: N-acetylglucosamine-6-phosphate deacetylase [Chthonomonadales bacterium]
MHLTARHYATGRPVHLEIEAGVISAIEEVAAAPEYLMWVAPGLVDLQVNGFGGHDFTCAGDGTTAHVVKALVQRGVTTILPTVITSPVSSIRRALSAIAAECRGDGMLSSAVAGIHLEGPFISPQSGARGAHPRRYVRAPDWDLYRQWQHAACGMIRLVTLAPEWTDAPAFICKLRRAGVRVAIGHTNASTMQIAAAVDAGARLSTHLGNGCAPLLPRHPNILWDQLAEDRLWASFIADGFHLPAAVVKSILRVKGRRTFLVSDVSPLAGLEPGPYQTAAGQRVELTSSGALRLASEKPHASSGLLAGSARTLLDGVEQLMRWRLASLHTAWDLASVRPARFLRLPQAAGLRPGAPADLVLFELAATGVRIRRVYKAGVPVWETS